MKVTLVDGDLTTEFMNKTDDCVYLGIDTETSGLDKQKDQLACFQVFAEHRNEPECMIVRRLTTVPRNIIRLMSSHKNRKIFHHAPFDLEFLMRDYAEMRPRSIACTKLMAKIFDPHNTKFYDPTKNRASHSLAALVYTFCGITLDKKLAVSNWFAAELTEAQVAYAVNDIKYLPTIFRELAGKLDDRQSEDYIAAIAGLPVHLHYKLIYGKKELYGYE